MRDKAFRREHSSHDSRKREDDTMRTKKPRIIENNEEDFIGNHHIWEGLTLQEIRSYFNEEDFSEGLP